VRHEISLSLDRLRFVCLSTVAQQLRQLCDIRRKPPFIRKTPDTMPIAGKA
jgi:hypothetical protein